TVTNLPGSSNKIAYLDITSAGGGGSDSTPPNIGGVFADNATSTRARIAWSTNEPANSQVEYGITTAYGSQTTLDTSMVTSHSQALSGLIASTVYNYRVKSRDAAGNLASSDNFTFTTAAAADTIPPVISFVTSSVVTNDSATITWVTNEPADSSVEYGTP